MKKYNRTEIMRRAWEIKRKLNNTLSEALKMSWMLAKKAVEFKEEYDRPEGTVRFNIWANYGKVRAYYTCSWRSKYQNNKGYYVAL
ncbi:hypothetical protein OR62_13785 [Clostridium tetani]|uniref:hypothetical protein n=1 Tax=Clostridium tetani TaxID=1513 RepID=UPI0005750386|nr:hypothetical protein [Clostridium tetani]KHO32078.1 hypothetical protein OR62_13785 [Clostridium tetani]RXI69222.1 hypothetical protein DQN76_08020 [Clostridium tetani]